MKWLAAAFALLIVMLIALDDMGRAGALTWMLDLPLGDKVVHFMLYGMLNLLAILAALEIWPRLEPLRVALVSSGVLSALTAIEEYSQRFFPDRHSSIYDWLAGFAGIVVLGWLAYWLEMRRRTSAMN